MPITQNCYRVIERPRNGILCAGLRYIYLEITLIVTLGFARLFHLQEICLSRFDKNEIGNTGFESHSFELSKSRGIRPVCSFVGYRKEEEAASNGYEIEVINELNLDVRFAQVSWQRLRLCSLRKDQAP